jgi:hypothetical protein
VVWEDGTPATPNDYRAHELDTRSLHATDNGGIECHMFPKIVAEVKFHRDEQDWVVTAPAFRPSAWDCTTRTLKMNRSSLSCIPSQWFIAQT